MAWPKSTITPMILGGSWWTIKPIHYFYATHWAETHIYIWIDTRIGTSGDQ